MMTARRRHTLDEKLRRHDVLVSVRHAERDQGGELDTARRTAIYNFIRDFSRTNGHSPSIREIGKAVELKTPSSVAHQVKQLRDAGVLRFTPGIPRSIVLITGGCAHCGCPGSHPDGAP